MRSDLDSLCARAWSAVKSPTDPDYENCVGDWRRTLQNRAEAILQGESPSALDNVLARFEAKVKELSYDPQPHGVEVGEQSEQQIDMNAYAQTALENMSQLSSSVTDFSDELPSASDDAHTLQNSQPTPDDDEEVSAAAKRLRKRKLVSKAPAKKAAKAKTPKAKKGAKK